MSEQTTRKIKLQSKYREMGWRAEIVPELRINGHWLAAAGFKAGEHVTIVVSEGQLLIEPVISGV